MDGDRSLNHLHITKVFYCMSYTIGDYYKTRLNPMPNDFRSDWATRSNQIELYSPLDFHLGPVEFYRLMKKFLVTIIPLLYLFIV